MATLDVLTVYQSWKGFQLFDEVMVQMHRYQFLKSWQWMSTVVRELQFSVTKPAEVYTTDTAES